jgi:Rod binding domain-containing protein
MKVEGSQIALLQQQARGPAEAKADMTPDEIKKAAKQFESYFLKHMLEEMRQTVPEGGLFEKGFSDDIYTGMLDDEYASLLADHGGIGLAAVLERQLTSQAGQVPETGLKMPAGEEEGT